MKKDTHKNQKRDCPVLNDSAEGGCHRFRRLFCFKLFPAFLSFETVFLFLRKCRQVFTQQKLESVLLIFFLVFMPSLCFAENPAAEDARLAELGENCKTATTEYKTALKTKRDSIDSQIKETEDTLIAEGDKEKRKQMVEHLKELHHQRELLSGKLRVINAGEVVKLSNKTNKIVSFLTGQ